MEDEDVWALARKTIEARVGRTTRARADLLVRVFEDSGLTVNPDNDPFRHVSVEGWSKDELERETTATQLSLEVKKRGSAFRNPNHPDFRRL